MCIAVAGCLLALYGLFDTFSNPWIDYSSVSLNELMNYYVEQSVIYLIVQTFAFTVAFVIGLGSVYKRYLVAWVIFTVVYAFSFILTYLESNYTIQGDDIVNYNMIISLLTLVGLIILIVKGGKAVPAEEQLNVQTKTPGQPQETSSSISIIAKSKELIQLKELLDKGIITEEEFASLKEKVLADKQPETLTSQPQETDPQKETEPKNTSAAMWLIGIIAVIAIILIFVIPSNKKSANSGSYNDYNAMTEVEVCEEEAAPDSNYY